MVLAANVGSSGEGVRTLISPAPLRIAGIGLFSLKILAEDDFHDLCLAHASHRIDSDRNSQACARN